MPSVWPGCWWPSRSTGPMVAADRRKGLRRGSLKALEPLLGDDTTVSAEVEILSSRMVLGRVVSKLQARHRCRTEDLAADRRCGGRRYEGDEPNSPWLGCRVLPGVAKKSRSIRSTCRSTRSTSGHTLIAGEGGTFEDLDEDDRLVLKGKGREPGQRPGLLDFCRPTQ
jgi:tyrosine-protein kinase Etk/Wzc